MGKKRTEKNRRKVASPAVPSADPIAVQPTATPQSLPKPARSTAATTWSTKPRVQWKPLAFVLAITFLVFLPSLPNNFVNWDDDVNVYENPQLRAFDWAHVKAIFGGTVMGNYNPLPV